MATSSSGRPRSAEGRMSRRGRVRSRLATLLATAIAAAMLAAGCSRSSGTNDGTWTPGRTPWGDPDIQGQWNSQTSTPLERPLTGELAGRETISEDEAEEFESRNRQTFDAPPTKGDPGTYNAFWRDEGKALTRSSIRRTAASRPTPPKRKPGSRPTGRSGSSAVRPIRTTTWACGRGAFRADGTASAAGTAATTRSSSRLTTWSSSRS
jgi:hypothetical protein